MIELEIQRAPNANVMGHICAMALSQYDPNRASKIKVPTLVIHGSEIRFSLLHAVVILQKTLKGHNFMKLKGWGMICRMH